MVVVSRRSGVMTEAEWSACTEPTSMLDFLEDKASERKLRLLACAIVRHVPITREGKTVWDLLPEYDWFASPRMNCHTVIETAERKADGLASVEEWEESLEHLSYVSLGTDPDFFADDPELRSLLWFGYSVALAFGHTISYSTPRDRIFLSRYMIGYLDYIKKYSMSLLHPKFERRVCQLIRETIGNPFGAVSFAPAWFTPDVVAIARALYDERAFDRMPILAEALEVAGCDNADILFHCRLHTGHVRGCWVLDALLAKE
jgi:hypothetical protein